MSMSEYIYAEQLFRLLWWACYAAGVVLALVKLRSMPKPAVFALVGFGLSLLTSIATTMLDTYVLGLDDAAGFMWLKVINLVANFTGFVAFTLIAAAIFVGRHMTDQKLAQTPQGPGAPAPLASHRATAMHALGSVFCTQCGAENIQESKFCFSCGAHFAPATGPR